ncbi:sn-glycerol-3-phosphate-binding periplasmic protein UgpB [Terrisporobacter petrolearius]|uniref:Sn-glycerol-3-phosphate-binding periplasmic protein UgpB n=1 Tax=Terrisporobacter petrolearius TaxID=1460447 RepID=A0ABZ3FBN3_9FIRM
MRKKLLSLLLCGVMMASMLVGCSTTKDEKKDNGENKATIATKVKEPVKITFWHAMSGVNEEAIKKITTDFESKNPNIKVDVVNQGDYLALFDKLMASAKSKQLPTITQVYSNRLSWYISKDLVTDLTPFMKDSETGFTDADYKDIPEVFLADGIWNEKQYAMPFNKSQMVLYYNEEMLKEAGIDVPTTWKEWADAAKKLTKDENGDGEPEVYGCVFANNLSTDIAPWVKQAGGSTMDEKTNKLHFDTPEMKEAVEFLNSMVQDKTARLAGDDQNANVPLQDGRAAMCVASTSALPYIEEGTAEGITINAAALPGNKTDDQLYYGTNVAVFNTATEQEQQAAWEYIKYLTSTENTAYFAAQTGYIPVRKSAQKDPEFSKILDEKPIKQLSFDCMDKGFQGTRNIGGINALDELGKQLDLVFNGKKDIDQALKDAQKKGTKALEEAKNN